jgi:hypothetical protein
MLTKTDAYDFSIPESFLKKIPQYAELERQKTKTDMACLPFKSKYIDRKGTLQEVTWIALWVGPELQYETPFLQNSLNLESPAIATMSDGQIVRKPYQWDCIISQNKEFIKDLLVESYKLPITEEELEKLLMEVKDSK